MLYIACNLKQYFLKVPPKLPKVHRQDHQEIPFLHRARQAIRQESKHPVHSPKECAYLKRGKDNEGFSDILTIYSLKNSELVMDMISEFRVLYETVDVRYETGEEAQEGMTVSEHIHALNTRILSGNGPRAICIVKSPPH